MEVDRAMLRASDADRELVVAALRHHHTEGRLDYDELTERSGRAYSARTLGDLAVLTGDLPAPSALPFPAPPPTTGLARAFARPRPLDDYRRAARHLYWAVIGYVGVSGTAIVTWAIIELPNTRDGMGFFWPAWPIGLGAVLVSCLALRVGLGAVVAGYQALRALGARFGLVTMGEPGPRWLERRARRLERRRA